MRASKQLHGNKIAALLKYHIWASVFSNAAYERHIPLVSKEMESPSTKECGSVEYLSGLMKWGFRQLFSPEERPYEPAHNLNKMAKMST